MTDTIPDNGKIVIFYKNKRYELNVRNVEMEIQDDYDYEVTEAFGKVVLPVPQRKVTIEAKLKTDENGYWGYVEENCEEQ